MFLTHRNRPTAVVTVVNYHKSEENHNDENLIKGKMSGVLHRLVDIWWP